MWFLRSAIALGLSLAAGLAAAETAREDLTVATSAGSHVFRVEIADEPRERSLGLMYRRSMAPDEGMLFDFETEQKLGFWMENTYIPLDMIFIRADGTVESIAERTTPLSRKTVPSKGNARFVLEINAGLSDSLGIEPGDVVSGPAIDARR